MRHDILTYFFLGIREAWGPGVVVVIVVVPVWDVCVCVCVVWCVCVVVVIVWIIVCVRNVWKVRRNVGVVVRVVIRVVIWVVVVTIIVIVFVYIVVVIFSNPLLFGVVVCVCDWCHVHFDIFGWVHV